MSLVARPAAAPKEHEERLARARAALGAAERSASRWGGRIDRTALRSIGGGRSGAAPAPGADGTPESRPGTSTAEEDLTTGTRLPVPGPLASLVPGGALRAGSSVAVRGAATTSLLLALAVAAAGEDAWCAVAGMPDLGLRAALDAGLDPHRLALAPAQGEQRPQVLSALADGVGVLVLGPDLDLAPALWRSLLGRARSADTLVLAAGPPGRADLVLDSAPLAWQGLGQGSGRLRRRRLRVSSQGRGIAGERATEVLLPQVGGMIGVAAPSRAAAPAEGTAPVPVARPAGVDIAPVTPRLALHPAPESSEAREPSDARRRAG